MIPLLYVKTEEQHFAFRNEDIQVVLQLPRLRRQAGDIPLIEGWFDYRGESFPAISLAKILGLGEEPPTISDHLLLTVELPKVAWRVRRVEGLGEVGWESLRMLEHSAEPSPCYAAFFEHAGQLIHLVNVSGLLLLEERERLQEAEKKKQTRLEELKVNNASLDELGMPIKGVSQGV